MFRGSALISHHPQNICMKPTCIGMTKGTTKIKCRVSMETSWRLTALALSACKDITVSRWALGLSSFRHYVAVGTWILLCTNALLILLDAEMTRNVLAQKLKLYWTQKITTLQAARSLIIVQGSTSDCIKTQLTFEFESWLSVVTIMVVFKNV